MEQLYKLRLLGVVSQKDVLKSAGISWSTLSRWVRDGHIKRVGRGLYMHPESSIAPEEIGFAIACIRFGPKAAIGGVTALFHYGLIEQVPQQIWVVVPSVTRDQSASNQFKCLRTKTNLKYGIDSKKYFKITNVERTLIESLKFSSKIGLNIVVKAFRRAIEEELTSGVKIGRMASLLKMENFLEKYWEIIL